MTIILNCTDQKSSSCEMTSRFFEHHLTNGSFHGHFMNILLALKFPSVSTLTSSEVASTKWQYSKCFLEVETLCQSFTSCKSVCIKYSLELMFEILSQHKC